MTLINGQPGTQVSIEDRGLLYGDGLFETIAVHNGQPTLWDRHMQRLMLGCARLAIPAPSLNLLYKEALDVIGGTQQAVLKVIITRGSAGRGYRASLTGPATRILSLHPWPNYPEHFRQQGVVVRICSTRLACNPLLAGLKHLNRLEQVLARGEWDDASIAEGLMLDTAGHVIEGTLSNIFAVRNDVLITPDLLASGVAGIMRGLILEQLPVLSITSRVVPFYVDELLTMQEIFLCNSLFGIWPVRELAGVSFPVGPLTRRIATHIDTLLKLC